MSDKRLDDMLKECFQEKYDLIQKVKNKTEQLLLEKQKKQDILMLWFIQAVFFAFVALIISLAVVFGHGAKVLIFAASYFVLTGLICAAVIWKNKTNNKRRVSK